MRLMIYLGEKLPTTVVGWNNFLVIVSALIFIISTVAGSRWIATLSLSTMVILTGTMFLTISLGTTTTAVRFFSLLKTNTVPVRLLLFDGDMVNSLATKNQDGTLDCPVHWAFGIGGCHLLPDGKVSRDSISPYVVMWWPLRRSDLVYHQLRNDVPDISEIMKMDKIDRMKKLSEML